ncbi:L-2-hydroxyglutarate dehydrogenase, mitochondrial [Athalia rosae]|uniref:L-2-hydroxyglutarate dehydrogenase, mitochondrial n=1 Tax=Athalia rosae TaxID=37344 RepID=UPI0020345F4E|nr:L-2-hydroxyglutarate dehydrogenase, mitochondrial [Athalia rosae]XP_012265373.2 L-2-hydroxyglutarate dehydrogenase, mitochondrial [Athalia rosae]XP_012265374.2 L-2-hydroxyglutarate dehydrogenase, mitochondrial [Athalia rosae]XP_012265376.2 L-2-hydroxyglutarate dehydrogenase, mitochondrial [Athalia rosae]XP_020711209.2 L-2-hydroxyglutarate dehydrogenase, mitochondrial [Athalia rosae]XP_048506431.1 L-2-hydroxyglutarate dehydrogenase, mitochondrial [Athalia rosae]
MPAAKLMITRMSICRQLNAEKYAKCYSTSSPSSSDRYPGTFDLVIVGGGIVGCATAREMLVRHPEMKIAIVEKETKLAMHQTGHNSGVVHAGIYYTPGSLKAKMCVEGAKLSYDYFSKNNIPYKKVGKLIVAKNATETQRINDLFVRGEKNGVPDLKIIEKDRIKDFEANIKGEKALWSPWTGIVDWGLVCNAFGEDFRKMGGEIFLNSEVTGFTEMIESKDAQGKLMPMVVHTRNNKYIPTRYVLTCAGLHSDRVAKLTGCDPNPRIVPFRGEYFRLSDAKKSLITTNVYPVPDPRLPFLGVHFTPRMSGDMWIGPNAVLAFSREGYSWTQMNLKDCLEMATFPGLYKLCFKYAVPGCHEMIKSIFPQLTIKDLQKTFPGLTKKDILRDKAGVRAQALNAKGELVDDFVFDGGQGSIGSRVIHCRNAPSPAATSSMAIAKFISDKLKKDFKL